MVRLILKPVLSGARVWGRAPNATGSLYERWQCVTPAKLNVFFAFFPYGGNGATSSEVPTVRKWFVPTVIAAKDDPRIGEVMSSDFSDTPITMTRNQAVIAARRSGADVLVMIDSDMYPDKRSGDAGSKPFFQSSFDFLYKRKIQGLATVIGAPYCGPPPKEYCYVFRWESRETESATPGYTIEMYPRHDAAIMSGIQQVAALPTGLIMYDMRVFDVTDPKHQYKMLVEKDGHTDAVARALTKPWFYYEWPDIYAAHKDSTEDVVNTRDQALVFQETEGYSPLFCNWDAWAGHWKPKCVDKPDVVTADNLNSQYRQAVLRGTKAGERIIDVDKSGIRIKRAGSNDGQDVPFDPHGVE